MSDYVPIAEVEIDFLPSHAGGPERTVQLRGFCPHFRSKSGRLYSVQFLEESGEVLDPGDGCTAIAQLMSLGTDDLPEGAPFDILEGTRLSVTVASSVMWSKHAI